MSKAMPRIGDRFLEARRPTIEWRVCQIRNGVITLARADKPSVERYLDRDSLRDTDRYRKVTHGQ